MSGSSVNVVARSESVGWRPGTTTYLLAGEAVGSKQLCAFEQLHEPGGGAPPHRHPGLEEVVTVLGGRGLFEVEGEEAQVEAVSTVIVPAGAEHSFTNVGDDPLWVMAVFASPIAQIEYSATPGEVLDIARQGGERHDAHRTYREE